MNNGLFITLYDEETLKLYLKNGVYGFLMKPLMTDKPNSRSVFFQILADYACIREGTEIFFFLKRKIYYGGTVIGNKNIGSFYLNGETSPQGRKLNAKLFWNEEDRYEKIENKTVDGVFKVNGSEKSQPFMICFDINLETGKYVSSDDLYFELGGFPYPLPSNSIQGMGFCTLTPGETNIIKNLIINSKNKIDYSNSKISNTLNDKTLFTDDVIDQNIINEAELEFNLLAAFDRFLSIINRKNYCLCRQVPISPFKPENMDKADICLYDLDDLINYGTIPNVVIELKKDLADFHAYEQVVRYIKWLEKILGDNVEHIEVYIVAPKHNIRKKKIEKLGMSDYMDKIKIYSLSESKFVELK